MSLSSLCSVRVSKSSLTLQLPSSNPCFHTPWQKCLSPSPLFQCFGKNVYKIGGNSGVFSQMSKLEALRTRTETKLLHSLAPWSRRGCAHLCNLELLWQHHEMLNFPWSIFCNVDLKRSFDITVIFKLLLIFQCLCLLDCPPAPKDQHPNH